MALTPEPEPSINRPLSRIKYRPAQLPASIDQGHLFEAAGTHVTDDVSDVLNTLRIPRGL